MYSLRPGIVVGERVAFGAKAIVGVVFVVVLIIGVVFVEVAVMEDVGKLQDVARKIIKEITTNL